MDTPSPANDQADQQPSAHKPSGTAVVHAALLTGLSFGAAMRATAPENGPISDITWVIAASLALLAAGDSLRSNGLIPRLNIKQGAPRLVVRVGAMVGSLMGVENFVNNPTDMAAFGIAAAATLVGAAVSASTSTSEVKSAPMSPCQRGPGM